MTYKQPNPTIEELMSLANRPALDLWELVQLIQGFCLNRKVGRGNINYNEEYDVPVNKIKQAIQTKELSFPIKPAKAVLWCAENSVPMPEEFSDAVIKKMFVLERPKQRLIATDELIRGSTSDVQAKHYGELNKKPGRKPKKSEPSIRGYESKICAEAKNFCITHIRLHGDMPQKRVINKALSKKLDRKEADINRSYYLDNLIEVKELNSAKRYYRRNTQENHEFS